MFDGADGENLLQAAQNVVQDVREVVVSESDGSRFSYFMEEIPRKIIAVIGVINLIARLHKMFLEWRYRPDNKNFVHVSVTTESREFTALKDWVSEKVLEQHNPAVTPVLELLPDIADKRVVLRDDCMVPFKGTVVTVAQVDNYDEYKNPRWTVKIPTSVVDDFYKEYNRLYALGGSKQHGIFRWPGFRWGRVGSLPSMRRVILPDGVVSGLVSDMRRFLKAEDWYSSKGIPWRRGYLFHGTPGSGKTSLVVALAVELQKDLHVISAANCRTDFSNALESLPPAAIILIEDVDSLFTTVRDQAEEHNAGTHRLPTFSGEPTFSDDPDGTTLSLSEFLNAVDGVAAHKSGRILILTTNHKKHLDAAVIRPGRIDVDVEFGYATDEQLVQLCARMLGDSGQAYFNTYLKNRTTPMTMATAENMLLVEALQKFNEEVT